VAIRRLAWKDTNVRRAVFGDDPRLPMLFQYNPLNHHVTVTDDAELVFTINRMDILSPRIAYNIHDEGGIATYAELRQRLLSAGVDIEALTPAAERSVRLPFLWVYGRKDSTVSVMGANIYPEDVEQALYDLPRLAAVTNSFCLGLEEQGTGDVRPCFSFEVRSPVTDALVCEFERGIIERVTAINADFRTAMGEHRLGVLPLIRLHGIGQGPFGRDGGRIKQTRIVSAPRASDA
jgi:phenylacetate-CoA ligase